MRQIKKQVHNFLVRFMLENAPVDFETLSGVAKLLNYDIYEYRQDSNFPETLELFDHLKLGEYYKFKKSFTYCDDACKIIFICYDAVQEDNYLLLLHEIAHIYLGHTSDGGIVSNNNIQEECEATLFAALFIKTIKARTFAKPIKHLVIITSVLCTVVCLTMLPFHRRDENINVGIDSSIPDNSRIQQTIYTDGAEPDIIPDPQHTYFWTKDGTVYHIYNDCHHLKNANEVFSGCMEESDKDRCCETCHIRFLLENAND